MTRCEVHTCFFALAPLKNLCYFIQYRTRRQTNLVANAYGQAQIAEVTVMGLTVTVVSG